MATMAELIEARAALHDLMTGIRNTGSLLGTRLMSTP
ncbi:hypothetical protein H6Y77_001822 [Salmonella enterica subsp. enterica serovar Reading]|nr:hypothetical protein [Salmonella enterica subsp. enterica serovar Reading]